MQAVGGVLALGRVLDAKVLRRKVGERHQHVGDGEIQVLILRVVRSTEDPPDPRSLLERHRRVPRSLPRGRTAHRAPPPCARPCASPLGPRGRTAQRPRSQHSSCSSRLVAPREPGASRSVQTSAPRDSRTISLAATGSWSVPSSAGGAYARQAHRCLSVRCGLPPRITPSHAVPRVQPAIGGSRRQMK